MCIQFIELKLVILCALLRFDWTILKTFGLVFQSVVESLMAHVGFFLRSFGIMFYLVTEFKTLSLVS